MPKYSLFPFKYSAVENSLAGLLIHEAEIGFMIVDLPDLELDCRAGKKRAAHLRCHTGRPLRLSGDQLADQHAAGESEGAQSLHDGLVELHVPGILGIDVDQVRVPVSL